MAPRFDLAVIGSGPAGQKGAICAAKHRKRVLVIDREEHVGGVSVHTGTIPSKTLREQVLYLSGFRQRAFYGKDYRVKDKISVADLQKRVRPVREHEVEVVRAQLKRNGVETLGGIARFVGPHELAIEQQGGETRHVEADHVLIACGTRAADTLPTDGKLIFNSDQLASVDDIPRHLIVVGGGVIGLEYVLMLVVFGGEVMLIDSCK